MSCADDAKGHREAEQAPGSDAPPRPSREASALRMHEGTDGDALWLQMRPSRMYAVPVVLFTFLWLRFLWRWYALVLLASADDSRGFLLVLGLPFIMAGMSLIGTSLRMVLGNFRVRVDPVCLTVREDTYLGGHKPEVSTPTAGIVRFVAECSAAAGDEDRDLDSWHVSAESADGRHLRLPLPVRSLEDARYVAARLDRALHLVRTPAGYRG